MKTLPLVPGCFCTVRRYVSTGSKSSLFGSSYLSVMDVVFKGGVLISVRKYVFSRSLSYPTLTSSIEIPLTSMSFEPSGTIIRVFT